MSSTEEHEEKSGRRKLLAVAVGVSLASILMALAAALGGLRISQLGAERGEVSNYDGGINLTWDDRDYAAAAAEFVVGGLTLTPGDPSKPFPVGHEFDVVLARSDGSVLYRAASVLVTNGATITVSLPGDGVSVRELARVAVSLEEPGA